jgi:dolichyl-phosphate-mannose-protein mannosyltransferase
MARFSFNAREISILAVLLFVAFTLRFLLFPMQGLPGDVNTYISWFSIAAQHGVRPFYTICWCDYPPFNVYIFWTAGSIANAISAYGINAVNIVKLVPNLFDLGTAAIIYFFLRKQATFKQSLLGTTLYAFNPAVIYNAAVWGQFDAIYTFFLVLSLMLALKSKPKFSAVVFAIAILTKPQGIALAPLLIYLIFRKNGVKDLLISVATFAATVFVVILPFEWANPVTFLSNIYFGAYSGYQVTSVNAFNFWGLFGLWMPDGNLYILGWALFGVSAALTLFVLHKRFKISGDWLAVFSAFMLFFAFFMLPTRIHERYLFPTISMLSLMFLFVKYSRPLYVALTGTFLVNQAYVLITVNAATHAGLSNPNHTGDPVVLTVSFINLVMFLYATVIMLTKSKWRGIFNQDKK